MVFLNTCRAGLLTLAALVFCQHALAEESADDQRAAVRSASQSALERLYQTQPELKPIIAKSAGYATFSNFGMKILVAGGGSGNGLAHENKTHKDTFMKMVEVQAGLGFGIKKTTRIFVFQNTAALTHFINQGWEFSGQATASASVNNTGISNYGGVQVMPGVYMFELTDTGLSAELTGKGTRFYKDDKLNLIK
ncbi:lipid-binding SYLF domain-containing protein [Silvimonas iriomotensis]|uniref:Ysc84 actin-binding domain-containing protein n=1 Tax=Silvimonas iriomotensis TaxID=449662 RepID=A0ABQ2P7K4_9NEIS|nr:hypothetical protein [Silvimonas iriomotensis]GGP19846.1 hypothetical protein GCM10010970_12640 [Silvimonas iriomotensis]